MGRWERSHGIVVPHRALVKVSRARQFSAENSVDGSLPLAGHVIRGPSGRPSAREPERPACGPVPGPTAATRTNRSASCSGARDRFQWLASGEGARAGTRSRRGVECGREVLDHGIGSRRRTPSATAVTPTPRRRVPAGRASARCRYCRWYAARGLRAGPLDQRCRPPAAGSVGTGRAGPAGSQVRPPRSALIAVPWRRPAAPRCPGRPRGPRRPCGTRAVPGADRG